jgi:acyl-CoA thioesterase FadM
MLFWLRMFKSQLATRFQRPLTPLETVTDTFRVWPGETLLGVTINSRYLDYAEVARVSWLTRIGLMRVASQEKWLPLMAAQTVQYKRPLRRFEKVKLSTRLLCWNERWFYSEHVFEREGKVMVTVLAKGCVRSSAGLVSPVQLLAKLGLHEPSPPLPESINQWESSMKVRL